MVWLKRKKNFFRWFHHSAWTCKIGQGGGGEAVVRGVNGRLQGSGNQGWLTFRDNITFFAILIT